MRTSFHYTGAMSGTSETFLHAAGTIPNVAAVRDPLLLACRYFDRVLAGYLDEDDLREIAVMVGDHMSRKGHAPVVFRHTRHM